MSITPRDEKIYYDPKFDEQIQKSYIKKIQQKDQIRVNTQDY